MQQSNQQSPGGREIGREIGQAAKAAQNRAAQNQPHDVSMIPGQARPPSMPALPPADELSDFLAMAEAIKQTEQGSSSGV